MLGFLLLTVLSLYKGTFFWALIPLRKKEDISESCKKMIFLIIMYKVILFHYLSISKRSRDVNRRMSWRSGECRHRKRLNPKATSILSFSRGWWMRRWRPLWRRSPALFGWRVMSGEEAGEGQEEPKEGKRMSRVSGQRLRRGRPPPDHKGKEEM